MPELAAGAAAELDDLRVACDEAVAGLATSSPDLLVVVGGGPATREHSATDWGTLAGYGVPVQVGAGAGRATLPLSITIGHWLVSRQDGALDHLARLSVSVDAAADPADAGDLGRSLADRAPRVAMLVLGDGSARRSLKGPGYLDPAAEPFDDLVVSALRDADPGALRDLEPGLAADLLVAGRAPWQVLAGAAGEGGPWDGLLRWAGAPYGVTYVVASWTTRPAP